MHNGATDARNSQPLRLHGRPGRTSLFQRMGLMAGALVAVGFLASACGGGSGGPGVASIGSTTSTTIAPAPSSGVLGGNLQQAYQSQLAYSECMRTHGEPNYPDPVLTGHGLTISGGKGLDPNSPQYISASTACKKLVPDGGPPSAAQIQATIAAALKFSECMRAHGVPNFPDPKVGNGGHSIQISLGGNGIDPNSTQFKDAQKTCSKIAPLAGPK